MRNTFILCREGSDQSFDLLLSGSVVFKPGAAALWAATRGRYEGNIYKSINLFIFKPVSFWTRRDRNAA